MCVPVYACACRCVHACACVAIRMCAYVCMCVHMCVHVCPCVCMCVHVCACVEMCACVSGSDSGIIQGPSFSCTDRHMRYHFVRITWQVCRGWNLLWLKTRSLPMPLVLADHKHLPLIVQNHNEAGINPNAVCTFRPGSVTGRRYGPLYESGGRRHIRSLLGRKGLG